MIDVTVVNTYEKALNDIFNLVGLQSSASDVFEDVLLKRPESRSVLYKWLVTLTLGKNFYSNRILVSDLVTDYLCPKIDNTENEFTSRSEISVTECLNTYIYLVLERYEYERLEKITLDDNQDPRELFLAVAFLISKDRWFQIENEYSDQFQKLKDSILECCVKDIDLSKMSLSDLEIIKEKDVGNKIVSDNKVSPNQIKNGVTKKDWFGTGSFSSGSKREKYESSDNYGTVIDKKEQFEEFILQIASDITTKATLLSRRKTVRSYDSELLRLIIGNSDYENKFLKSMDDISSNQTEMTREEFDKLTYSTDFSQEIEDSQEWNDVMNEIIRLSNVIIQLQSKIRHLTRSIESHDLERLTYFSKNTNEFKDYQRMDQFDVKSTFINDRFKQPSPVEFAFISDPLLFKRHTNIMNVIMKSLENEISRTDLWKKALKVLEHVQKEDDPNVVNVNSGGFSGFTEPNNNIINVYSKPADIKYNVHILKSFLVEGIPNENFVDRPLNNDLTYFKSSIDFLRKVNLKYANFKAGMVSDKNGRKPTFSMFVMSEIETGKDRGLIDESIYNSTNDSIKRFFHLYENVEVKRTRVSVPLMAEWIEGIDHFENISKGKSRNLSEAVINSISDSKRKDYDSLDRDNFRVIENLINGVYEPEKPESAPTPLTKSICDIINYDYYFEMCKSNYEVVKEAEVNFMGFSSEIERINSDALASTNANIEKSSKMISAISDLIKDNTDMHLVF